jgi:hypothetical protein
MNYIKFIQKNLIRLKSHQRKKKINETVSHL